MRAWLLAAAAALGVAVTAAAVLRARGPLPSAEVALGTEDAFARGLHARELPPRQAPQRWTTNRAAFRFEGLGGGPCRVEVRVRGQRTPVEVQIGGARLGTLAPGQRALDVPLPACGSLAVDLATEGFRAGDGRQLGTLLERVTVVPESSVRLQTRDLLLFLLPALVTVLAAFASGVPALVAAGLAALAAVAQVFLAWRGGLLASPHATALSATLVVAAAAAALLARLLARGEPRARPWAFAAVLAASLVQGVAATSPAMVVSDVVFHAHKLEEVAAGNLFPTSVTQHAKPFRFPYGVSFYLLLVPFLKAGGDSVAVVRAGAGVSAVLASAGLFWLLVRRSPRTAALAVLLLQLMPGTFDVHSFGNLSNVFGQSMTALAFAWWAGGVPGGPALGVLALVLAALGHFSSCIVLVPIVAGLAWAGWRGAEAADPARVQKLAVAIAALLVAAYYLNFARLVLEQVPRLLEGGGQGRGASRSAFDAVKLQLLGAWGQWGWPVLALALAGRPRASRGPLERDLVAYLVAGALLALPAVASPLDVRYLYALTLPVAAAAAFGLEALLARGRGGAALAGLLLVAQAWLGLQNLVEAVVSRYR